MVNRIRTINNEVQLAGELFVRPDEDKNVEIGGTVYHFTTMKVPRLSEVYDYIPVMIPEYLIAELKDAAGKSIRVEGFFRSWKSFEQGHKRLHMCVMVKRLHYMKHRSDLNLNNIFLRGRLCHKPTKRVTAKGKDICDLIISVKKNYGYDYRFPCIAWGNNAQVVSEMEVGDEISVWGRIQSRDYIKKISESECQNKTAYEVSVSHIKSRYYDDYWINKVAENKIKYNYKDKVRKKLYTEV